MMELQFPLEQVYSLTLVDGEQFGNIAKICGMNFNIGLINIYWEFCLYS